MRSGQSPYLAENPWEDLRTYKGIYANPFILARRFASFRIIRKDDPRIHKHLEFTHEQSIELFRTYIREVCNVDNAGLTCWALMEDIITFEWKTNKRLTAAQFIMPPSGCNLFRRFKCRALHRSLRWLYTELSRRPEVLLFCSCRREALCHVDVLREEVFFRWMTYDRPLVEIFPQSNSNVPSLTNISESPTPSVQTTLHLEDDTAKDRWGRLSKEQIFLAISESKQKKFVIK